MYVEQDRFIQMTQSPIKGLILRMAVPSMASMLVTAIYNMVDTYYVGMLEDTNATAAVGAAFSFMTLIQAFGFFFGNALYDIDILADGAFSGSFHFAWVEAAQRNTSFSHAGAQNVEDCV